MNKIILLLTFIFIPALLFAQKNKSKENQNIEQIFQEQNLDNDKPNAKDLEAIGLKEKKKDVDLNQGMLQPAILAEFPGGHTRLLNYIGKHVEYPKEARENNIQGKVMVQFTVSETGKIDPKSIKILKSPGKALSQEAIRVILQMPDWKPALTTDGKPVSCYYLLPINFIMN